MDANLYRLYNIMQWRIQDFPEGGAPTYFLTNFSRISPKNCMKMKKFCVGGHASLAPPPLDPPLT